MCRSAVQIIIRVLDVRTSDTALCIAADLSVFIETGNMLTMTYAMRAQVGTEAS